MVETRDIDVGKAPLRILVVEDHDDSRIVLLRLLRKLGYEAMGVATGAEALRACDERKPDLLICDLGLPDISGLELMADVRRRCGVPGLAVTGYGMPQEVEQCVAAGFARHLLKPVSLEKLELAISQVAAGR
jgi:CheY-like chemotaxis protein